MPRSSNLFGVTVSSRGNVRNGQLSTQSAVSVRSNNPLASDKTGHLARQIQQSSATANTATQPCDNPPTLTLNLTPVQRLTLPAGQIQQGFGECGPDLRNIPQATLSGIFPVLIPTIPEPTYVDRQKDWKDIADKKTSGNSFKPILDSGVGTSPFRPELIMLSDYLPLYQRGGDLRLSDSGLFVDVMFQAQKLRQQTLAKIIARIQEKNVRTQADDQFKLVVEKYDNTISKLEKDLAVASEIQKKTSELRKILDVRQIPDTEYDSKYFLSLNDFATEKMQYSTRQTQRFSNTKLLAQLLFDLRSTLQNYSVGLLDLTDRDRTTDNSPINIDKTYTISNGFSFNLNSLAANQKDLNATDVLFVNSFLSSLPTKKQEVIKVLSVLLCKELSVSKGLGNKITKNQIDNTFNTQNNQNIFQSIIGDVGNTIFEINSTPGTLFSLLVRDVPSNANVKILPFENKYFDAENNQSVFVPGSSYYADSIFDIDSTSPGWNTKPIIDYVTNYIKVSDQGIKLLSSLLGYDSPSVLFPTELIKNIYLEMNQVLSGLVDKDKVDKDSALLSSIIKLSEKDNQLRNLLFQYAILAGMRMNGTAQESVAFKLLANELQNVSALSLVRLNSRTTDDPSNVRLADGERAFGQYLEATAAAIEERVDKILSSSVKRNKVKRQNTVNVMNVKNKNPDYFVGDVRINNITGALRRALRTRTTYSFLKSFVDNFDRLIVASQENGVNNFLNNNKTNNSGLNVSTLALMFYELCASFYATYTGSTIEQTKDDTTVTVDVKSNNSIRSALYELGRKNIPVPTYTDIVGSIEKKEINPKRNPINLLSLEPVDNTEITQQTKKTELYSILIKLSEEQIIPANVLYILQTIKAYIRNNSTSTLTFFQQNKLQNYLVSNNVDSDKLEVLQNPSQLRVSAHALDVVKSLTPTKVMIDGIRQVSAQTNKLVLTDNLTPNEYSLIKLMMSESPYLPEANYSPEKQIKLLSIGVPAGFSKQLVDRVNIEDVTNESFLSRQSDVIDVLIYKRDLRFEDIVFKPLKFSFDMSLFVDQQSIDSLSINENMHFSNVLRNLLMADYPFDAENGYRKKLLSYRDISTNPEYIRVLPNIRDRQAMFKNHVVSYILDMYMSLLTGLKVDETTFIQTQSKPERSIDREVFQIVYTYVRDIVDKNFPPLPSLESDAQVSALIQEILNNTTYNQKAKDYFRLFTYGTIAFNTEYLTALVNQPKIFDRVFHVPVDTAEFEVDLDATLSTESGRQAWQSTYVQDRLTKTQDGFYKVKPRTATELIFEDFFIRIETAIDKD